MRTQKWVVRPRTSFGRHFDPFGIWRCNGTEGPLCHSFALRLLPKHTAALHLNRSTLLPSPSSAARTVGGHSNRRLVKLVHGGASHRDSARGWLHDLLCGGEGFPRGGGSTGLVMGEAFAGAWSSSPRSGASTAEAVALGASSVVTF